MRLVLDSSVLIDFLRGDPRAQQTVLDAVEAEHELWGVVVSRTEVIAGMREDEVEATLGLLDRLCWLAVDQEVADRAGQLARRYLRTHPGVGTVDYLIAAGVQALDASLVTMNVRHFPMFQGLRAPY